MKHVPKLLPEAIDRGTKPGWIKYMNLRPAYFEWLVRKPYTPENVEIEATRLFKRERMWRG